MIKQKESDTVKIRPSMLAGSLHNQIHLTNDEDQELMNLLEHF